MQRMLYDIVNAEQVAIGKRKILKRKSDGSTSEVMTEDHCMLVPFDEQFRAIFRDATCRGAILQFRKERLVRSDNKIKHYYDGQYYKQNTFFKNHPEAIAIDFYYDDVNPNADLSSSATKVNQCNCMLCLCDILCTGCIVLLHCQGPRPEPEF